MQLSQANYKNKKWLSWCHEAAHCMHIAIKAPTDTGCFKKVAPLKLFGLFSLRLSLFALNFASVLSIHIHSYLPIICRFSLIYQMALLFPRVPIVFTRQLWVFIYKMKMQCTSFSEMTSFFVIACLSVHCMVYCNFSASY